MTVDSLVIFVIIEKMSASIGIVPTLCLFTKFGNVGMINRG